MKIGTVRWFNLHKGYGFIHPDDGSPNIFVDMSAVTSAGMTDLREGQRVIFEIRQDGRGGYASAASLKSLELATTPHLDDHFATTESVRRHFCLYLGENCRACGCDERGSRFAGPTN